MATQKCCILLGRSTGLPFAHFATRISLAEITSKTNGKKPSEFQHDIETKKQKKYVQEMAQNQNRPKQIPKNNLQTFDNTSDKLRSNFWGCPMHFSPNLGFPDWNPLGFIVKAIVETASGVLFPTLKDHIAVGMVIWISSRNRTAHKTILVV